MTDSKLLTAAHAEIVRLREELPAYEHRFNSETRPVILTTPSAPVSPVCSHCGDTHEVDTERGRQMCTWCPVPCQKCRIGGNGAFCETTPCACKCHRKPASGDESEET